MARTPPKETVKESRQRGARQRQRNAKKIKEKALEYQRKLRLQKKGYVGGKTARGRIV